MPFWAIRVLIERMRRLYFVLLVSCALAFLNGCTTYHRRWREAAADAPVRDRAARVGVEGSYEGTWKSSENGFGGKLWCIVTPLPKGRDSYRAEFRATWHGVFASEHDLIIHGRRQPRGGVRFSDTAEIRMWIGSGSYRATGEIRDGLFKAEYDANYDRGAFRLSRATEKRR